MSQLDAPNGWGYLRDVAEPANDSATRADLDSRIGVQVNYAANAQFELVSQVLLTRQPAESNIGDNVTLAFAAYKPDADWTVRIGRVNFDAYLLSDHHDVGFAYEFARPPVEFYEQLPTYLNGVDLSHVWDESGTLWRIKGLAGTTAVSSDAARFRVRSVFGVVFSRQDADLLVRASVIRARLENGPPVLVPLTNALARLSTLPVTDVASQASAFNWELGFQGYIRYFALGAEYDHADWLWSSEITRVRGIRAFDAGYGSVGRRFGPVSVYGIVSAITTPQRVASAPNWDAELSPLIGASAAQQAQMLAIAAADAVNHLESRQHTVSLGARWNLTTQMAVKAQWDHIRVDADGSGLWSDATLASAHANVYSIVLDFIF